MIRSLLSLQNHIAPTIYNPLTPETRLHRKAPTPELVFHNYQNYKDAFTGNYEINSDIRTDATVTVT